jgi:hypothetical protein
LAGAVDAASVELFFGVVDNTDPPGGPATTGEPHPINGEGPVTEIAREPLDQPIRSTE